MQPLIEEDNEKLEWDFYPNLVRIRSEMDGSCLFHSILGAYHKGYRLGQIDGKSVSKREIVSKLRKELSEHLDKKVTGTDKTYYETLGNGEVSKLGKKNPNYTLTSLVSLMNSNSPLSDIFNQMISDILDLDIYILDMKNQNVYKQASDINIMYKNRKSIVILYLEDPGHYETIGVIQDDKIKTLFSPSHDLITTIKENL